MQRSKLLHFLQNLLLDGLTFLAALAWFLFAGGLFLLHGCAARKNAGSPGKVVIPHDCIYSIDVTPETYCEVDGKKILCRNATVTHAPGCETLSVKKPKQGDSKK